MFSSNVIISIYYTTNTTTTALFNVTYNIYSLFDQTKKSHKWTYTKHK